MGLGAFYSKVLTVGPNGTHPDLEMYYLPVACQHCDNPQCVSVCPTGASYKREDGIVLVDHSTHRMPDVRRQRCPYGVRTYDDAPDKGRHREVHDMRPSHRTRAKCPPACSIAPDQVRKFGDIEDRKEVSKRRFEEPSSIDVQPIRA